MVPYVGMNAEAIGRQVGTELARMYKAEGWDKANDVRIGSIEDQKADTCMRRNRAPKRRSLKRSPVSTRTTSCAFPMTTTWKAR